MTLAYTTFPNGGVPAFPPGMIREIRDVSGKWISPPLEWKPARAMSEATAKAVSACLAASARGGEAEEKGKSGTTPTFTDAWYFGYDETHTWGVWIGRDSFTPIHPLAFGGALAKPLAGAILAEAGTDNRKEQAKGEKIPAAASVVPATLLEKP